MLDYITNTIDYTMLTCAILYYNIARCSIPDRLAHVVGAALEMLVELDDVRVVA